MANETPSRPPPFMANAILNFHFDYVTPSLMAYGGGPLKEKFLKGEIRYNPNEYFIHANATDFKRELPDVDPSQEVPTNQKKRRLLE